jgi:DNA-binding SARP family transcriptional activator
MEFRVLGPLEALGDDGRPVRLGGQRERALLALLLTRPNQVVSVDAIVDGLWGGQPPQKRREDPAVARGAAAARARTRPATRGAR